MKTVLTFGVFDMMHIGHILLFERAKALGDKLIVDVQRSETVYKYKPEVKLVYNTDERMYMVNSVRFVDEVVLYSDVDIDIKNIDFDVLVTGEDQIHQGFQNAKSWCLKMGKDVITLTRTEGISSTLLRDYKKL